MKYRVQIYLSGSPIYVAYLYSTYTVTRVMTFKLWWNCDVLFEAADFQNLDYTVCIIHVGIDTSHVCQFNLLSHVGLSRQYSTSRSCWLRQFYNAGRQAYIKAQYFFVSHVLLSAMLLPRLPLVTLAVTCPLNTTCQHDSSSKL